ncbi:hypothetical protein [Steroidobacter sp.]|uniref:hypothetical protein n=1 Tax=Steroidobacter sp. TaxID=1978227 RepID=UPI001A55B42C|nr:hypothetical protein [Steroidobacter sp.]MBL8265947.1 hypothetical protein [Steroidobacter sp.]
MNILMNGFRGLMMLVALALTGCVTRPPSIAHVHLGHALTGVHVTPNREGYLVVARERAEQALSSAQQAASAATLEELKTHIEATLTAVSSEDNFGLKQSLVLAANHISFAATSEDASANVQSAAPVFASDITRVVERCELVTLLGKDVAKSQSKEEAAIFVGEIVTLTTANVEGEDADGDGKVGTTAAEYGVKQLRAEFDTMIARENPAYRTVDQWYLFNLVRLPNGRWVFDKLNRGGNIEGYK